MNILGFCCRSTVFHHRWLSSPLEMLHDTRSSPRPRDADFFSVRPSGHPVRSAPVSVAVGFTLDLLPRGLEGPCKALCAAAQEERG